jgi:hypothetical protein
LWTKRTAPPVLQKLLTLGTAVENFEFPIKKSFCVAFFQKSGFFLLI